jgi:hypothetical protein
MAATETTIPNEMIVLFGPKPKDFNVPFFSNIMDGFVTNTKTMVKI